MYKDWSNCHMFLHPVFYYLKDNLETRSRFVMVRNILNKTVDQNASF